MYRTWWSVDFGFECMGGQSGLLLWAPCLEGPIEFLASEVIASSSFSCPNQSLLIYLLSISQNTMRCFSVVWYVNFYFFALVSLTLLSSSTVVLVASQEHWPKWLIYRLQLEFKKLKHLLKTASAELPFRKGSWWQVRFRMLFLILGLDT